jgi:hypothetical protein
VRKSNLTWASPNLFAQGILLCNTY